MDAQEVCSWSCVAALSLQDTKRRAATVRGSSLGFLSRETLIACETVEAQCTALVSALQTLRYAVRRAERVRESSGLDHLAGED